MADLTRGRRSRLVLFATVLGLVVALAIIVPTSDATGQEQTAVEDPAGVLLVNTGPDEGDNWVRYYADPVAPLDVGAFDAEQSIDVSSTCGVTTDGSLLEISETGGGRGAGLISNGYGVRKRDSCSWWSGRVNHHQSLTFTLGSFFEENVEMTSGEVDVESKFGADLDYTVALGEDVFSDSVDLTNTSYWFHEKGTKDNNLVVVDAPINFRSVTFIPDVMGAPWTYKSSVSIEGGGDGILPGGTDRTQLGVNQTLFRLVSLREFDAGDLDCGEIVGETAPPEEGGPAEMITLGRGENLKGEDLCVELAYTFRIEADSVLLDGDFAAQPNANLLVHIVWDASDPVIDPFNTPHREINYFPDVDIEDYDPVSACVKLLDEGTVIDPDPDPDDVYEHPIGPVGSPPKFDEAIVPWCLAAERLVLLDSGDWQQEQWYDGAGDPRFR